MNKILHFLRDESGATAIEYGLLASLIAVALITAITTLGTSLEEKFGSVASAIQN